MALEGITTENRNAIVSRVLRNLVSNSPIAALTPGSATIALLEGLANEIASTTIESFNNILNSYLPNASGDMLDFIGKIYGLTRKGPQQIESSSSDTVMRFFVSNGTFGNINSGTGFTIPTGVKITVTGNTTFALASPVFVTTEAVLVSDGDTEAYVGVRSISDSGSRTISPKTATLHDFVGYTDANKRLLRVENRFSLSEVAGETDSNLRFRITQVQQTLATSNLAAVRLELLTHPQVNTVSISENTDGAGSFTAYILGNSPFLPQSQLDFLKSRVLIVKAAGIRAFVEEVEFIGLSMDIELTYETNTLQSDKAIAEIAVNNRITSFLGLRQIEEAISRADLIREALTASNKIKGVKIPNLLFWRTSKLEETRFSTLLKESQDEIIPKSNQVIILEPVVNAVNVTEAS